MARQWKKQATVAYGYALARLALNSYMYFEELPESYDSASVALCKQEQIDSWYQKLLSDFVYGNLEAETITDLRRQVQTEMEEIIALIDSFRIYEYVLNRVERRFDDSHPVSGLTDAEFTKEIMGFIGTVKEAADMNRRIQEVIGQLPIRFTRQKYYSMVQEALTAYIGAQGEALENVMYLLHTAGMTELGPEKKSEYPELYEYLEELEKITYRSLTNEEYRRADQIVSLAGEMLNALSEYYQMMQEMINDLYLICITKEDAVRDVSREMYSINILKGLLEMKGSEIPEKVEQELYGLEGVQEEYYEKYMRLDPVPDYQEGEPEEITKMRIADLLMSTSTFVSLDQKQCMQTVTREDTERAFDDFVKKMEQVFAGCQKPVMRAIMAATLSVLPICFNSAGEVQSYVENSLGGCSDMAEKEACIELIHQLMEIEDYASV